jgi:hypothetical protein
LPPPLRCLDDLRLLHFLHVRVGLGTHLLECTLKIAATLFVATQGGDARPPLVVADTRAVKQEQRSAAIDDGVSVGSLATRWHQQPPHHRKRGNDR